MLGEETSHVSRRCLWKSGTEGKRERCGEEIEENEFYLCDIRLQLWDFFLRFRLATVLILVDTIHMGIAIGHSGVGVIGAFLLKILLQYMSIWRFDAFIVEIFRFHNFKAKFLVELYGTLVVHLNMPEKHPSHHSVIPSTIPPNNPAHTYRNILSKLPSFSTYLRIWLTITVPMPSLLYG